MCWSFTALRLSPFISMQTQLTSTVAHLTPVPTPPRNVPLRSPLTMKSCVAGATVSTPPSAPGGEGCIENPLANVSHLPLPVGMNRIASVITAEAGGDGCDGQYKTVHMHMLKIQVTTSPHSCENLKKKTRLSVQHILFIPALGDHVHAEHRVDEQQ